MSDDLVKLCRDRADTYGALRSSSLTAIALDRAADRIKRLDYALACIANKDWTDMTPDDARRMAVEALGYEP